MTAVSTAEGAPSLSSGKRNIIIMATLASELNRVVVVSRDENKRPVLTVEEHTILARENVNIHHSLLRIEDVTENKLDDRSRCAEVIRRLRANLSQLRCLLDNVMNDDHYGTRSPYFRSAEAGNEPR